jgi:hypothetical protein
LQTQLRRSFFEQLHLLFAVALLVILQALVDVLVSPLEHAIHQTGELVRHRGDRLWRTESGAEATVLCAEVALTPQQRGGGQPKGRRGSIDDVPGAFANHLASGNAIIRTQPEPGGEVRLGLPARHLHADFADDGLGYADIDTVDPGQVDAADAVQFTT